jgi:Circularly permutated YpsA SLOG family
VVSGGQTGVDRGALDAARAAGVPIGGWVPRGRWAEDGSVPDAYGELREAPSLDPSERTRRNVEDSDGTLLVSHGPLMGGSARTLRVAEQLGKPCLWLDLDDARVAAAAVDRARAWIERYAIGVLNVAGPRASEDPRGYAAAFELITRLALSSSFDRSRE